MQQTAPDEGDCPLLIMFANIEVAGYYEEGRWIPVKFGEYVRLSKQSESLSYLQPVDGFAGIDWRQPTQGFPAEIAMPYFQPNVEQISPLRQ